MPREGWAWPSEKALSHLVERQALGPSSLGPERISSSHFHSVTLEDAYCGPNMRSSLHSLKRVYHVTGTLPTTLVRTTVFMSSQSNGGIRH